MTDKARSFDGVAGTYIDHPIPTGLVINDGWAMGMWISPAGFGVDGQTILRIGPTGSDVTRGITLATKTGHQLQLATPQQTIGATALVSGSWYGVGVCHGGSGASFAVISINGSVDASPGTDAFTEVQAGDVVRLSDTNVTLDELYYSGSLAWFFWLQSIVIDGPTIYSYLNNPQALVSDYGPSGAITPNALKILWPMQCGAAAEVDKSGQGNDGTYNGTTLISAGPSPTTSWTDVCGIVTAALNLGGSITGSITEVDILTGGRTIILTLTNDTWQPSGASFDGKRQTLINGLTSSLAAPYGWNSRVKPTLNVTDVTRTSNTVITVTVEAIDGYFITNQEWITTTVSSSLLTSTTSDLTAPQSFSIDMMPNKMIIVPGIGNSVMGSGPTQAIITKLSK